ncbi:hypothetical protein DS2_15114 [Catenovulum agarivorans DS-2]|uniref:Uncharacterized protein n=1 Tax=Catenovulum agarivorans DS-2 TaxID=1328313 RepID=W7QU28_9ALTE|nr:hypothetical protein [Catenovulum agarivorans]EWH08950.1 hypothetical protein DS2_15114 [Catenovulum agarivorans DS-2]
MNNVNIKNVTFAMLFILPCLAGASFAKDSFKKTPFHNEMLADLDNIHSKLKDKDDQSTKQKKADKSDKSDKVAAKRLFAEYEKYQKKQMNKVGNGKARKHKRELKIANGKELKRKIVEFKGKKHAQ